jgi:alkanesulfonate monooxygenase SsuD/methylene tetrahydromethanopterin reductase-like flavin-dependent oxidoreductase (luciferase family)
MEPNRLLAFAAASGRIGVVFLIGGQVKDWRISNFAARSPEAAARYADKLVAFLKPDVVVTERFSRAAHKGNASRSMVEAMALVASNHEVLDVTVNREREAGGRVDEKNIKKHRNDVARLLQLLSPDASYALPDTVANDMRSFVEMAKAEADYDPKQFKVSMTREDVADRLRAAYQL